MAFVQETGAGLSNSNGYTSEAFFVEYHTDRGRSLLDPSTEAQWTTTQIQGAIVLCSDFLDAKFTFIGLRLLTTQNMEWPRTNAFYQDGRVADGVPIEIQEAVAELALKVLQGVDLAPDPGYDDNLRPIQRVREKVGPIETDTEYAEGGGTVNFKAYPFAERRLKELIVTGHFVERV